MNFDIMFSHNNFQDFLKAWIENEHSQSNNISLGQMSRNLKLSSSAELINILKGRRPVSHKFLEKFCDHYKLSEEHSFYLSLISENDRNKNNLILSGLIREKIYSLQSLTKS